MTSASQFPRTLKRAIEFAGVGLHSGRHVRVRVAPSQPTAAPPPPLNPLSGGIVFRHLQALDRPAIRACAAALDPSKSMLCTQLRASDDSWRVSTVEHLMAALVAARVTHASVELVECDAPSDHVVELPILDGSALPFVQALQDAGTQDLTTMGPLSYLRIKRPVQVLMDDKAAWFLPIPAQIPGILSPTLHISVQVNFSHRNLGSRHFQFTLSHDADDNLGSFTEEIAPARTFTFEDEIAWMRQNNLALGGSLDNAVVFRTHTQQQQEQQQQEDQQIQVLNPDGLRFPADEWVRHKLLDCIGDLGLVGMPVHGHFFATSPGHALTHRLVEQLLADPANYELIH